MAEPTFFDYLNAINYKKKIDYDKTIASAYMLLLWFSHDKTLLSKLNRINQYLFNLEDEIVYNYLYNVIPSGRRFLKWVKKDKTESKKQMEKELEEYNLSKREIMLYNKFIK